MLNFLRDLDYYESGSLLKTNIKIKFADIKFQFNFTVKITDVNSHLKAIYIFLKPLDEIHCFA